jgi:hypothetical protein
MLGQISASSLIHELAPRGGVQPELVSSSAAEPLRRPDTFGSSAAVLSDIRDKQAVPALSPARTSTPRRVASALPIGIFFYLLCLGIVATATVGIFFGIGFFFLAQTTQAMNANAGTRAHRADSERLPSQVARDEPSTYSDSASIPIEPPIPRSAAASPAAPVPQPQEQSSPIDEISAGDAKVQSVSKAAPGPNASEASPSASPPAAQPAEAPGARSTAQPAIAGAARLSAAQIAELLARGDSFLHAGDVVAARLFYERAADAGHWQAAIRMGATFDSAFLLRAGVRTAGDPIKAQSWYRHALDLGAPKTDRQLESPQTK